MGVHTLTAIPPATAPSNGARGPALLADAPEGESGRFTRPDGVVEDWRVMQPLLDAPPPVQPYAKDSWGPSSAAGVMAGHGRWRTRVTA